MTDHILTRAKAYAALLGAVITAILGTVPPHTRVWTILTGVAAVATAVTTYAVPNSDEPADGEAGAVSVGTICLVVIAAVLTLSWLGIHGHVG